MEHTVYLDDTTANGRKLLKELRQYQTGVRFDYMTTENAVPDGYMTSEEFRRRAVIKVNKFCELHGIL
jgi:hypothetical protein